MGDVYVNWLAVGLAGLSSLIVGSIWYAKPIYGSLWLKLAKLDEKKLAKRGARPFVIAVAMSFVMAYVLAHVAALSAAFFETSALSAALSTAFWLWLGISLTTVAVHDIFEGRPWKLTFVTAGYQFFLLLAMGLVIGLIGGF